MSSQPQAAKLAPDLVTGVTSLPRSLVAAPRNRTLYPPEHLAGRVPAERWPRSSGRSPSIAPRGAAAVAPKASGARAAVRRDETMRNLAAATATLDPHVVMEIVRSEDDAADTTRFIQGLTGALDDMKVRDTRVVYPRAVVEAIDPDSWRSTWL